ncbi:RNA polymerase sigma factor SigJ [Vineibacter terrae]|uniref:RNA polymerase sigma factor SigJ n=1 Tax=Vineibacter terrae TaxID=2586908 RepID=UPI002E3156ED|nr:RNA polymerase sigma factor SigJ [Vineibacter terrae]HEX2885760.1 RNA polymerase sigma factor SigJ [Vineibacter terrae]
MPAGSEASIFEAARPMLMGLAYRMLGSRADAEDAVQDTFLKWQKADRRAIDNPASWLTTACTRRCIDLLRSAHRARVDYVGTWLPEPIHTASEAMSAEDLSLAGSLTTAFLLLLERLTPRERAAYLLHEIFDVAYADIARTLGVQESTCRKLVARARGNIDRSDVRHVTPADRQEELVAAFEAAIAGGGTDRLAALLAHDVALSADGGGKVATVQHVVRGKAAVLDFVGRLLRSYWSPYAWVATEINGGRGAILRHGGHAVAAVSFAYDADGRATDIFIVRNPDKLARLGGIVVS